MIPPYVIINSPANNTLFNVSSISINITATDLNLNYTNVSLINSTGAVVNSTINTTNGTFVVQLGVPYDGVYNITATAYDKANNTNTTTVKNITVLLTPPSININYPYNDSLINSSTISINLTVISIGINYTNVSLINSTGSVVNSTASTNTGTYIVQLGIPYDDIFNITATAYDLVGRSNSSTRTNLSVDMPPAIAFTSITPANGTVTMNNTFEINISVNETSLRRFVWNWNGTNYTLYDSNLKLMLNFNNVSALGENSSSNYTADTSLFNNICVCAGMGAGCSWTAGKHGAALSFNGSTSYVDCGNSTNLTNMTTSLSMEAWIYPNEWMTLYDTILESSTGGEGYRIWSPAGGTSIGATIYNGTSVVRVNSDLTLATWTHVLATYNGSDFILYINGMAVNTTITSGSITTTTPRFAIGRDTALGRYFNGRIDEVRIYNRVLSPSEVLDHYQSSLYKYDKNKWAFYINPSNLTEGVYTYQGFANDSRGSTGQTSPSPRYITIIHPTNLTIWDDTDVSRKYVNDSVKFYANYTSARNGNPVVGASCNISFETPAGWTTPVSMNYNVTSKLYEYNRTFNFSGTYNFSVNCSKQFYQAHNATSTYWITGAVVYVYTDQNTYQACNILYYKIWVYDASDSLIDSNLTIKIYNSSNSLQNATSANTGNGGTGVYLGNYILNSTSDLGKWLIEVVASSIVKGTQNFFIGTAPTRWKIDIDFSPDSIVYNSGTNITMNFTVWTKEGVRQTGLLPGDLSVLIDNTNVTAGLSASGEGYVYSYTASPGHHIVNATSGNVTNIRGFTVR
ncbi:MAG: LamG domain-containing protein, partial [Candidatus Micrarchaeia archaeon]